jgi:hypothetical protein
MIYDPILGNWFSRHDWETKVIAMLRGSFPEIENVRIWGAIDIGA